MTRTNPFAVPASTAAMIAELGLADAPVSPQVRVARARRARAEMTPQQRAVVGRNQMRANAEMLDRAAHTLNSASIAVYGNRARLLVQDPPTEAEMELAGRKRRGSR